MTRKLISLFAGVVLVLGAATAQAAIPRLINFQGRLADASGTPKTGSFTMTFSFWTASSGGTSCFSESQAVAANSGLFNVNIGSATSGGIATTCDFSVPYYLQLQVGTDSAMSPRISLTAAAYALRAEMANNSALLGGYSVGSASGNIPRNEGTLMTNLNADLLDGHHWSEVATTVTSTVAKGLYVGNAVCSTGAGQPVLAATCAVHLDGTCLTNYCYNVPACPSGCTQTAYTAASCTNNVPTNCYRDCSCPNTFLGYIR